MSLQNDFYVMEDISKVNLNHLKVLVVDDQADYRQLMTLILQRYGATCYQARSVDTALSALREHQPDLILTDLSMPVKSGYDLIRVLKSQLPEEKAPQVPVVAVTAFSDENSRRKTASEGFDAYLCKPFTSKEFVSLVASVTRSIH